jgi:hypothetical protein
MSRSGRLVFVAALVVGALAALWLCDLGYGVDDDAWAGARAAVHFAETGVYEPSRLPGNPLFEWALALLVPWGGHRASNVFVLLSHAVLVSAFWRQYGERPNRALWTGTVALTPVLFLNATTTMDYVPGLALALLGYTAACRGRPRASALWLGLSIGVRLSNVLLAIPFALVLAARAPRRALAEFALSCAVVGGAPYLPILWRYGLVMLSLPPTPGSAGQIALRMGYNAVGLFGPIASLGLAVMLSRRARAIAASLSGAARGRDPEVLAELAAIALTVGLFVLHPDETEYLLPALPFAYRLLSRWLTRPLAVAACALVLSDGLVTIELKGGESGHRGFAFTPRWGTVVQGFDDRRELEALRRGVAAFDRAEPAVIMTGMPQAVTFENRGLEPVPAEQVVALLGRPHANIRRVRGREVYVVEQLSLDQVERLRAAGFHLFIFSVYAPSLALNVLHYDPSLYFERLEILSDRAFYRQGPQPSSTSSGTPSAMPHTSDAFGVSVSNT